MSTQARLPGTLPTPAEARRRLGEAATAEQKARDEVQGWNDHAKAAKEEIEAAEKELAEVERVLVDAPEESEAAVSAELEWDKAWARRSHAEAGLANVRAASRGAKADWKRAKARLLTVRQDIAAIRLGRRTS